MGTGKTCVALGAVENYRKLKKNIIENYCPIGMEWMKENQTGAIILSPPRKILLNNLMNELIQKCSDNPKKYFKDSESEEFTISLKTYIKKKF